MAEGEMDGATAPARGRKIASRSAAADTGQPPEVTFDIDTVTVRPGVLLVGPVAVLGLVAGIGLGRLRRPTG
jgi:hypothetical protein